MKTVLDFINAVIKYTYEIVLKKLYPLFHSAALMLILNIKAFLVNMRLTYMHFRII